MDSSEFRVLSSEFKFDVPSSRPDSHFVTFVIRANTDRIESHYRHQPIRRGQGVYLCRLSDLAVE